MRINIKLNGRNEEGDEILIERDTAGLWERESVRISEKKGIREPDPPGLVASRSL